MNTFTRDTYNTVRNLQRVLLNSHTHTRTLQSIKYCIQEEIYRGGIVQKRYQYKWNGKKAAWAAYIYTLF